MSGFNLEPTADTNMVYNTHILSVKLLSTEREREREREREKDFEY